MECQDEVFDAKSGWFHLDLDAVCVLLAKWFVLHDY